MSGPEDVWRKLTRAYQRGKALAAKAAELARTTLFSFEDWRDALEYLADQNQPAQDDLIRIIGTVAACGGRTVSSVMREAIGTDNMPGPLRQRRPDPDPVVQALNVVTRTLRDWPPNAPVARIPPGPAEEWDPAPFVPGGDRYIPKIVTYGTPVIPTSFIPFDKPKTPEQLREEAAAKVLGVFRELGVRAEELAP